MMAWLVLLVLLVLRAMKGLNILLCSFSETTLSKDFSLLRDSGSRFLSLLMWFVVQGSIPTY